MKFEKVTVEPFESISVTLETELEIIFMSKIFNASNAELRNITDMYSSEIESVLNRTNGYKDTSNQKLKSLWSR